MELLATVTDDGGGGGAALGSPEVTGSFGTDITVGGTDIGSGGLELELLSMGGVLATNGSGWTSGSGDTKPGIPDGCACVALLGIRLEPH